jgi:hypothetical protein
MGLAFAKTGKLFAFFSPLLGWLGVALTGSDTSSTAVFGSLQKLTAPAWSARSCSPRPICSLVSCRRRGQFPPLRQNLEGRSHSDALVGSTVWSATARSSPVRLSRSTSSRRRALNASIVLAAL